MRNAFFAMLIFAVGCSDAASQDGANGNGSSGGGSGSTNGSGGGSSIGGGGGGSADGGSLPDDGGGVPHVNPTSNSLDSATPGQWIEIANTHVASVAYSGPLAAEIHGTEGPAAVIDDWCGGVLNSDDDSLMVWGGGHKGYYGNEAYAFSLNTLTWSMKGSPSSVAGWDHLSTTLPDGRPATAHSRGSLAYLPGRGMLVVAAEAANDNGDGRISGVLFNPSTGAWSSRASAGSGVGYGFSAVDVMPTSPTYGHVFAAGELLGGSATYGLFEYDPAADSWTRHGTDGLITYSINGAVDGVHGKVVVVGGNTIQATSTSGAESGTFTTPTTSGDKTIEAANGPGFVWYPKANVFVGWAGGANVYTLDPTTWAWTVHAPSAGNAVIPSAANGEGTYGRFQYDAGHDVFVVVNRLGENVFVYKADF